MLRQLNCALVFSFLLFFASVAAAQEHYSPYTDRDFPEEVYWGDTHLHTNISVDAYARGNRSLGPDAAYRFARGDEVMAHNGMRARLSRPLDFLVIADHAVNMGVMSRLSNADPELLKTEMGQRWYNALVGTPYSTHEALNAQTGEALSESFDYFDKGKGRGGVIWNSWYYKESDRDNAEIFLDENIRKSVWSNATALADQYNTPGTFTAFIGFEWTAQALYQTKSAIHRVVIFKDSAEKAVSVTPFSYFDSDNPEDLWAYLAEYERKTGGEAIAIPHNSNGSNGVMFTLRNNVGEFLFGNEARNYAIRRSRWEPLMEATQTKGDSETHPILSPKDDFANFEIWNGWNGWKLDGNDTPGWEERRRYDYARSALQLGLRHSADLGVNPFKFGMIGSTDSHTSLSTADENNYWGKLSLQEPSRHRVSNEWSVYNPKRKGTWEFAAAGYAAVWAHENTRESLFAAMKRKEVYATTGPRITLRFFGGWDYDKDDAFRSDLAAIGYEGGVPMGGDLTAAPTGEAPKFLIRAVKDPDGANLDRVQVIKGWRSEDGELHEKVYDVALSDDRKIRKNKRSKSVGSTVDVEDASYTNTIGDPELAVVWEDPDFEPQELAFYYVRVIEIPTPRWTAYDAKYFDIPREDIPDEVPMVTQERAYSSPIWYSPS